VTDPVTRRAGRHRARRHRRAWDLGDDRGAAACRSMVRSAATGRWRSAPS